VSALVSAGALSERHTLVLRHCIEHYLHTAAAAATDAAARRGASIDELLTAPASLRWSGYDTEYITANLYWPAGDSCVAMRQRAAAAAADHFFSAPLQLVHRVVHDIKWTPLSFTHSFHNRIKYEPIFTIHSQATAGEINLININCYEAKTRREILLTSCSSLILKITFMRKINP